MSHSDHRLVLQSIAAFGAWFLITPFIWWVAPTWLFAICAFGCLGSAVFAAAVFLTATNDATSDQWHDDNRFLDP